MANKIADWSWIKRENVIKSTSTIITDHRIANTLVDTAVYTTNSQ